MKPRVFKMGGAWIWRCTGHQGTVGDEFQEGSWRHPWDACIAVATRHVVQFHDAGKSVESIDLGGL